MIFDSITTNFEFGENIGNGKFGTVYKATCKNTGKIVAIKKLDKLRFQNIKMYDVNREINIHKLLKHPNIIEYYGTITDDDSIYIIMQYIEGIELFESIITKTLSKERIKPIITSVINAIIYCNAKGVIHRDIKPENILITNSDTYLIDFGYSIQLNAPNDVTEGLCGTCEYIAPELIEGIPYSLTIDNWAIGILIYELLSDGITPFGGDTYKELYENICNGHYKCPSHFSNDAIDLINRLLKHDPSERLSLHDVLNHPFLKTETKI